jgi:antitoxin (DNA-binding transcriptional repressor) of toxin-antitoxin stability system
MLETTIAQLLGHAEDYFDSVEGGNTVRVFRNGKPIADIVPLCTSRTFAHQFIIDAAPGVEPLPLHYREILAGVIQLVVRERRSIDEAFGMLHLTDQNAPGLRSFLKADLNTLAFHNCASFRLSADITESWIRAGRPQ